MLYLFVNADNGKIETRKEAWTSKAKIEQKFVELMASNPSDNEYHKLSDVMKDIFYLYDYINIALSKEHSKQKEAPKGSEFISKSRSKTGFNLLFMGTTNNFTCAISVLLPILGAFKSQLVLDKKTKKFKWKNGLKGVTKLVDKKIVKIYETNCQFTDKTRSDDGKTRPYLLGNNDVFWERMMNVVLS